MTLTDPNDQVSPIEAPEGTIENQPTAEGSQECLPHLATEVGRSAGTSLPPDGAALDTQSAGSSADTAAAASRPRILIGSQRDPAAYRPRPKRDWTPVEEGEGRKKRGERRGKRQVAGGGGWVAGKGKNEDSSVPPSASAIVATAGAAVQLPHQRNDEPPHQPDSLTSNPQSLIPNLQSLIPNPSVDPSPLSPLPSPLSSDLDLETELSRAMGDASMDELLGGGSQADEQTFEPDSLQSGRVVTVRRDDVFVEFGGRQQGVVSLRQFDVPPRPGAEVQVMVQRLNPEDGLYELSLPNKAVQVDDWSDLVEGALVEVRVTGHNTGGLECEVNHIRGFIPISQVSLYRVEDLAPLVDQRLTCIIMEADPERRNLVVSRRAVLEREREQLREQMLNSLRPGQIHEGVVRKIMDFGAFVDLGGVDGLLHVSQVAWGRVKHPKDVLKEGQTIKVRIEKVDPTTGKISLAYRDLLESPWTAAAQKYPPNSIVRGAVTKLMEFGAFVELEPGIEGLVHISELSHKRVWRSSDVVKEGEQVEVLVLAVDPEAQRISLSMKALAAAPEPVKKDESAADAAAAKPSKKIAKPAGPLRGGLSRSTGDRFGLKW